MINANELRIGNLVLFDEKVDVIYSIGETIASGQNHSFFHYKRLSPIPLTSEMLEKCGFKKEQFIGGYDGGNYYLNIGNETKICSDVNGFWVDKMVDGYDFSVGLGGGKYIHQLQNIYFSLCNEELKIDLS